ncbi:MAG: rhomboid family intramembrane serine protease [Sphingobacteriales bacterium]|nr:MAG: rhomboid family intramembrane serine protease [Sphingobacteriales bacterium]
MKTMYRKPFNSMRPGYSENAVLQLIVACGVGFIAYHMSRVTLLVAEAQPQTFPKIFTYNLGLAELSYYKHKVWTVFTYGWVHNGFWELFSNMIWLYCFGNVLQMLTGYRQVIPVFVYSLVMGGIFYEVAQFIPSIQAGGFLFGAQAGVIGLAAAALTFAPNYRFYFGEHFSVPIAAIAVIFLALSVMNANLEGARLILLAGGALTGFVYVKLLQNGYKPGAWPYEMFSRLDTAFSPDEQKIRAKNNKKRNEVINRMQSHHTTQSRVDNILDKINTQGYNSLTKEEREILMNAGKDNDK